MTERKITYALNRIQACKDKGCGMEALLRSYHLNLDVIRYILSNLVDSYSVKDRKGKALVHELVREIPNNPHLKSILNKKNIKAVKPWLGKMEDFFKTLKSGQPSNLKALQAESEKIFGILSISVNKLFIRNRA